MESASTFFQQVIKSGSGVGSVQNITIFFVLSMLAATKIIHKKILYYKKYSQIINFKDWNPCRERLI